MSQETRFQNWHLLDARAIWVKELARALSQIVNLTCWIPDITWNGCLKEYERIEKHPNPELDLHHFPLQRGFAKWPLQGLLNEDRRIARRLIGHQDHSESAVLVCVSPHYARVAERWRGPVIYYMSDLYYAWGEDPAYVNERDRQMCRHADLVCPVSERGKEYLIEKCGCPAEKIAISPMATRASNLLPAPLERPAELPADIANLPRPIIGIIGNLAKNTDWLFLQKSIAELSGYSWVFVGSTEMPVPDADHRQAREALLRVGGNVRFLGAKPYHELAGYARSFDIALLPYRKIEPTYSGSSTRYYEHLAACRPMFATDGFAELLSKEPLVYVVTGAQDFVATVKALGECKGVDGIEADRWKASQSETWEARAMAMGEELVRRVWRVNQVREP